MLFYLFLLFAVIPIVEIYVLVQVGSSLGAPTTIGLVILTAAIGASLVRSQGLSTLMSVQERLNQGQIPGQQIVEGILLAVAGVLLVTPGFVTDFFGLLILTPFTRAPIAAALLEKLQMRMVNGQGFAAGFGGHSSFSGYSGFSERSGFEQQDFEPQGFEQQGVEQSRKRFEHNDSSERKPAGGHTIDGDFERKD